MNHSKNKSSDMLYILGQLEDKGIAVTLHSGKCFSGTLLLDHIVREKTCFNDLNWWRNCGNNSPVIHLRSDYDYTESWVLVSEIAVLRHEQQLKEPHETSDQD